MVSEKDVFSISGPIYLTDVDWKNLDHRRSIAASLVQGVYILERDRQQNRKGAEALAPPWWEFFHFQLIRTLIDDTDFSVFGAIYELKSIADGQRHLALGAPNYVIAFRGTITKGESSSRDLNLNLHFIQNGLHRTSRIEMAIQAVRGVVSATGHSNIWLAGHSLGSAVAMLAGKTMAKTGVVLEAFLFNPPFVSPPIERIKDKKVKQGIRIAGSLITAGFAIAMKARGTPCSDDSFAKLSAWVPNLYVNPADHICSEYVGYFEHRKKMEEIGAGNIERLATQHSLGDLFLTAMGKESESSHLLPSANLTINLSPSADFKQAHGIHQWLAPHFQSKYMSCRYD